MPLEIVTIILILTAATLHAIWNAMVKGSVDRVVSIGLVASGNAIFGICLALFSAPPAPESWPYIGLTFAIHFFYFVFLVRAYELGDFSRMYPIARGVAPVLVALAAMIVAGEEFSLPAWFGILIICCGISLLAFVRLSSEPQPGAVVAALLTGLTIAIYTVVDGLGVRASGSPAGYIGWSFGIQLLLGLGFLWWRRNALPEIGARRMALGVLGGLISGLSYAIVIYTMSFTQLGAVSAIRESSVVIGALIGVIWFSERPWLPRLLAAIMVASGIILLSLNS